MGISVFVSSGDEGAASCDANKTVATHGIAVSGFTSTPYNVSVGGTDFGDFYANLQTGGPALSTYWSSSNSTADGSALSYIPEIPWNDSCASELIYTTPAQAGVAYTQSYGATGFCNSATGKADFRTTGSGSGGPSTYEVGSKPTWQSVLGNPSDNTRDIPDVSLFAANGVWDHFLLYCLSDTAEGGTPCNYASSNFTNVLDDLAAGGTSFASPIMAGIQALINQNADATIGQGNPNPRYYALGDIEYGGGGSTACNSSLGAGIGSGCVFNDVTLGDIDVNCSGTAAADDCFGTSGTGKNAVDGALSTSTSALSIAYGTNSGWDFATGLGSVNAWNLIQDWTSVVTTTAVSTSLTPSPFGQSVTFTATITPGIGNTETGTVTWSANTGCAVSTVSSGTATCTTTVLPVGTDTVTAAYSGDSNYATSTCSFSETIQPVATITVGTSPSGLAFTVDGTSYTSTQSFTWVVGSTHSLSTTASQAGIGTQYTFAGWSDGTATVADSITVPSTATTYTASFSTSYLLTIAASNPAYGSVTLASGSYFTPGVSVTITATPSAGYYFVNWTGSADIASPTSASTTVTMNSPESITANFAPLPLLVVNTAGDADNGVAAHCTSQATATNNTTDSACSLRDALTFAAASTAPTINIGFDATAFAAAQTIALNNGTLNIPSNTAINGPTTGSAGTLADLVTVNANNASTVFTVGSSVTGSSISSLTITGGNGSSSGNGGGIGNQGALTLTDSTIFNNSADGSFGGGIQNLGTLTLTGSTIFGNTAFNGQGAGIFNAGTLTATNSTISSNAALGGGAGGGIFNIVGALTLTGNTISANNSTYGGGIFISPGATVNLANTIVTGNTADADIDGSYTDNGGNQVTTGIALAPLASYGGPTLTMLPLPGDPSICGGFSSNAIGTEDQRGLPFNPVCPAGLVDSGAAQTNYAISFFTEPASANGIDLAFSPAPVVELTESGNLFAPGAGPIVMTDNDGVLGGTTSTNTVSGYASFNGLTISTAETSDTLTATLTLGFASTTPARKPAAKTVVNGNVKQAKPEFALTPLNITATSSSFSAAKSSQSISFSVTGEQYVNTTIPLTATTTSGLPVGYVSVHPTICTVSGTIGGTWTTSLLAVGECSIQAYQWGNASYTSATRVFVNFYVHPQPQTITFPVIAEPVYAASSVALSATATSGLAVSFVSTTPTICTVANTDGAWSASLNAGGSCTIEAKQPGNSIWGVAPVVTQSFTVKLNSQIIAFPVIAEPVYAASSVALSATATSGLAVSFVSTTPTICTVSNTNGAWSASLNAGGSCTIEAKQPGNSIWLAAPVVTQSFYIERNAQTITFPPIAEPVYVGSSVTPAATASSGLAVTYVTVHPTICTVSQSGGVWSIKLIAVGECSVEAQQAGSSIYNGAPFTFQNFYVHPQP